MLKDYLTLQFDVKGKSLKGFCLKINDEFYETYAVILEGCQSFVIWLDQSKSCWRASKNTNIDAGVLEQIIILFSADSQPAAS